MPVLKFGISQRYRTCTYAPEISHPSLPSAIRLFLTWLAIAHEGDTKQVKVKQQQSLLACSPVQHELIITICLLRGEQEPIRALPLRFIRHYRVRSSVAERYNHFTQAVLI